ncbi:DNA-binding protein [Pantoea sp. Bo_2]|uniref:Rha family transcriptional regulator n=2 Tax=unclassified Pantoea TaxID=2630326 RepID=UPI001232BCC5|nr:MULTISPECIES: Rha family transcriptional regulator [unclassified Pantoea]KAA6039304.1 DNA-binding protein [Pantoea sp. FN_2b]KAA6044171.1 DNA-binding protein [Pantoea sp. Bo_5]KAA6053149.1 DNA-binding protein [Pantoea sp. Bo_46]KAA6066637.1 DNA-binding protein [Pantoea sp. Bo_21]KAA6067483.1 DNA-binding protein [Pantoea sp. Bo_2]
MNNLITNKPSMTSLDIAELVGSRHSDVKRSIERLAERDIIRLPPVAFVERINNLGHTVKGEVYNFEGEEGKRDSIIVVAQLSPEFTARLVDRWRELEEVVSHQPLSEMEMIAAMAADAVRQQKRISHVEEKIESVAETVESIKRGTVPAGWIGFSELKTKFGMSPLKCKTLASAFNVPTDTHKFLTPDGLLGSRGIVNHASFMAALRQMMSEAECRGTRWWHPKMGIFQILKWGE